MKPASIFDSINLDNFPRQHKRYERCEPEGFLRCEPEGFLRCEPEGFFLFCVF
jgi:hypothetical protein